MTNRDKDFYPTMGPFLARREIEKEIGGRLYDEDDRVWYVAVARGQVVGFCAARQTSTGAVYQSAYVLPDYRRQGVYRALWKARAEDFPGPAHAVVTDASLPAFLADGFRKEGAKGRFWRVRRD